MSAGLMDAKEPMLFLVTLLVPVLCTIILIPVFSRAAFRFKALDLPNDRKVHTQPIPRSGGPAMALGAFAPILFFNSESGFVAAYCAGAGVLVVFGLLDDFRDLRPWIKLVGQVAAALIVIHFGGVQIRTLGMLAPDGYLLSPWLALPLTLLVIVGVTNAINLADGLDGLAGGICLLIFCCMGYLAYLEGNTTLGLISLAFAGAIFGFLRFNTHPASVFMGDAGSQLLGFSAITLSLALTQEHTALSPLLPLILVGFPVLDTLTVMISRMVQGRSPFAADKNHFHHNLMALGFLHSESVLIIYFIQTVLIVAALKLRYHSDWLLLGGYLLFSTLILGCFSAARQTGWTIKRFDLLDVLVMGRLRSLRDHGAFLTVGFSLFHYGLPLLLLVACLLSAQVPGAICSASLVCAALLVALWLTTRDSFNGLLRLTLYLLIPFAVYFSEKNLPHVLNPGSIKVYHGVFWIFALGIVLLSKFSRRRGGFKSTPLDFLILFIVAVGLNLSEQSPQELSLGLVAVKIIILYFCYEVLLAELHGKFGRVALATLGSLLVLAAR
jgi:UDP-GlcNAc:undecaprenyl-phosphate/decaprenyl-phosphate GlcNAc-1-phosphate transferase